MSVSSIVNDVAIVRVVTLLAIVAHYLTLDVLLSHFAFIICQKFYLSNLNSRSHPT